MSEDERFTDAKLDEIVSILDEGENFYAESSLWFDSRLAAAADDASEAIGRLRRKLAEAERKCELLEHIEADLKDRIRSLGGNP